MSNEMEIGAEVDSATRALEAVISAHLAAGANRCVLAAACVWSGVREMSEVTSSESAAAALRTVADQIDPPSDIRRPRIASLADLALVAGMRERARAGDAPEQNATEAGRQVAVNRDIAGEIVSEAIDLLDQGHATRARALLMALRVRFFRRPRQRAPASQSRRELRP